MSTFPPEFTANQLMYIEAAIETVKGFADTDEEREICQHILNMIKY